MHLTYLSAPRLLTAVCEKLVQGKSDLAAVQGLTCITQLQAFSYRKEGRFCTQVTVIVLGKGVLSLSLCTLAQRRAMERRNNEKLLHKAVIVPTLAKVLEYQPFCCCTREPDAEYKNQW